MNSARPLPHRPEPSRRTPSRLRTLLDPRSWTGALMIMTLVAALLWIVQAINSQHRLTQYGLQPRHLVGLRGVITEPFLHSNWQHLLSNTLPLILIGWVLLLAGLRTWAIVTGIVVVGGGLLTWLVAPSDQIIVGASGMVFGWLAFLLARAVFSRKIRWIIVAVLVLFFFGTLLFGVFPILHPDTSWQAHVCGFAAGILAAGLLHHPRGGPGVLGRSVS